MRQFFHVNFWCPLRDNTYYNFWRINVISRWKPSFLNLHFQSPPIFFFFFSITALRESFSHTSNFTYQYFLYQGTVFSPEKYYCYAMLILSHRQFAVIFDISHIFTLFHFIYNTIAITPAK